MVSAFYMTLHFMAKYEYLVGPKTSEISLPTDGWVERCRIGGTHAITTLILYRTYLLRTTFSSAFCEKSIQNFVSR